MEIDQILTLLNAVKDGQTSIDDALTRLREIPFSNLDFAKIDHHRSLRTGAPEVIFCQGKTPQQVCQIAERQIEHDETVFGTRASAEIIEAVVDRFSDVEVNDAGRCFWRKSSTWQNKVAVKGTIIIASAGTADAPVTEEARCTLEILGHTCVAIQDVGVAGIHRLLAHQKQLSEAAVIIAIAGMEGALPSVIAGLVSCPIIAVPTSIGYGAHLNGLVPLFAMLNSCGSGLSVVNVDNGFGAAMAAARINAL
jgi:NCAIR mutase (PurE)-related protein